VKRRLLVHEDVKQMINTKEATEIVQFLNTCIPPSDATTIGWYLGSQTDSMNRLVDIVLLWIPSLKKKDVLSLFESLCQTWDFTTLKTFLGLILTKKNIQLVRKKSSPKDELANKNIPQARYFLHPEVSFGEMICYALKGLQGKTSVSNINAASVFVKEFLVDDLLVLAGPQRTDPEHIFDTTLHGFPMDIIINTCRCYADLNDMDGMNFPEFLTPLWTRLISVFNIERGQPNPEDFSEDLRELGFNFLKVKGTKITPRTTKMMTVLLPGFRKLPLAKQQEILTGMEISKPSNPNFWNNI